MSIDLQIDYPGQCEAAFRLYEHCLDGRLTTLLRYAESPIAAQYLDFGDKVAHATLVLGDFTLAGVDLPPARYRPPQGFTVLLNLDKEEDARRIFVTLSTGGKVLVPLQPTFGAELYAVFTDRFGTPWKVNYSRASPGQGDPLTERNTAVAGEASP